MQNIVKNSDAMEDNKKDIEMNSDNISINKKGIITNSDAISSNKKAMDVNSEAISTIVKEVMGDNSDTMKSIEENREAILVNIANIS